MGIFAGYEIADCEFGTGKVILEKQRGMLPDMLGTPATSGSLFYLCRNVDCSVLFCERNQLATAQAYRANLFGRCDY